MSTLSAIVIAKDEERNIAGCLESLSFADEIVVVVDSKTCDQTQSIAERYTRQVYVEDWLGYAETKQSAVRKTSGNWILWIDADELVTPECAEEIRRAIRSHCLHAGYRLGRKAYFLGKWIRHGGWYPGLVVRLFRKDCGKFNSSAVHEGLVIQGTIGNLKAPILHYTDDTLEHYLHKFNEYTSLAAEELFERKKTYRFSDLIFRPMHMFMKMYVWKLGFLDGAEGLILAVLSGNYVFCKYSKLFELRFKSERI